MAFSSQPLQKYVSSPVVPLDEAPVVESSDEVPLVSPGCPDEPGAPVLPVCAAVEPPEVAGPSEVEPLAALGEPSSPHPATAAATATVPKNNLTMPRWSPETPGAFNRDARG